MSPEQINKREEKIKYEVWNEYFKRCEYNPDFKGIDLELLYHNEAVV
jgi:hypothetical protein